MKSKTYIYLLAFTTFTLLVAACGPARDGSAETGPVELAAYEPNAELTASDGGETDADQQGAADTSTSNNASAADNAANDSGAAPLAGDRAANIVRGEYNGEVVAKEQVAVVAEVNGQALAVTVDVGDRVTEGQLLVRVDSTLAEAQSAQTLAGLEGARAQLDQLVRAAEPEDLAAAQAAINAANAAYNRAVRGADAEDLTIAQTQLRQAEAAVRVAQSAYNEVRWNPKIGMMPQSLQLQQATLQLEAVQAQYQKVLNGAGDDAVAGAYAQVVQAQAQLARLQEGANSDQIRAVQAQVQQAELALYLSQLQIDKSTIEAPISGTVAQVNISTGGMVGPGSPLVVILSDEVEINIPVEETRLPTLVIGQPALIRSNAYPDRVFEGRVTIIAPQLNAQTRTVQVTIRPTEAAPELLPGMFAAVDLVE